MNSNVLRPSAVMICLLMFFSSAENAFCQPGINGGKPIISYVTYGPVSIQTQSPPSFPDGDNALKAFVLTSIRETENPVKLPRKVWLTTTIDKDGNVTKLVPTYDADPALKREMERVAGLMPRWNPGLINGKGVETQYQFLVKR